MKKHGALPCVIDATGGLCQDAWALASAGCRLLVIEQHPVVHALVADGLHRARLYASQHKQPPVPQFKEPQLTEPQLVNTVNDTPEDDIADTAARISLLHANASDYLSSMARHQQHVIYLDPMYPAKRKNAASKKGMQFLQSLLGPATPNNDAQLLGAATECGVPRVVVKRPKGAGLLAGSELFSGQRTVIESPNTRYDIYISHENSDTA